MKREIRELYDLKSTPEPEVITSKKSHEEDPIESSDVKLRDDTHERKCECREVTYQPYNLTNYSEQQIVSPTIANATPFNYVHWPVDPLLYRSAVYTNCKSLYEELLYLTIRQSINSTNVNKFPENSYSRTQDCNFWKKN